MDRTYLKIIYRYAMLFAAAVGICLILITTSVAGASTLIAPTRTAAPPPKPTSPCGVLVAREENGGFPRLDLAKCSEPDTAPPSGRRPWNPIAVGAPVCVNWTLYHTNLAGSWNIFRLGEVPGKKKADPNISKGSGVNVVDMSPSRSPDGMWVAFTTNRDGNWEIYVAASDGSSLQRVTYTSTAANLAPMWSPDGKSIAYSSTRNGSSNLYRVDVATGVETRLTDGPAEDRNPVWSPDSKKIVFESSRDKTWQIYELDLTSKAATRLGDGKGNDHNPQYAPDGKRIAFRSDRDGQPSAIYVMNVDGSGPTLISDPKGKAENQVWSADGALIAYDSNLYGNYDIFVYQLATQQTRRVTENTVRDVAPTWRCNGAFVIFTSDIIGAPNLFQTSALPMNNRPIKPEDINELTFDQATNQYPVNSPAVEDASQRGQSANP